MLVEQDPLCELKEFDDDKKAFAFVAMDFSEKESSQEKFFIRVTSVDNATILKDAWNAAKEFNKVLGSGGGLEANCRKRKTSVGSSGRGAEIRKQKYGDRCNRLRKKGKGK